MANERIIEQQTFVERSTRTRPYHSAVRFVYFLVEAVELLLIVRLTLRLIGASAASSFTQLVYNATSPLVAPFRGIVASNAQLPTFEWATVIAMMVWALLGYAIVRLIDMATD